MQPVRRIHPRAVLCAAVLALATTAHAANRTWTGAADVAYTNGANWAGGVVPTNGDYGDTAVFTENSPGNKTPTLYANRSVQIVKFDNSVGWTFDGGSSRTLVLRQILSSGTGTNTFTVQVKTYQGSNGWTVNAGNTVVLAGGMYLDSSSQPTTLGGGGSLLLNAAIGGWSGTRQFRVANGVLRVAASSPTGSTGSTLITAKTGRIQILNTVAGAKALIGTRILDGVGDGLAVKDIGGGYVEVSVAPLATVITIR